MDRQAGKDEVNVKQEEGTHGQSDLIPQEPEAQPLQITPTNMKGLHNHTEAEPYRTYHLMSVLCSRF